MNSNMGSKARESTKAMGFAFVLLDFQHAGIRSTRRSVHMYQFRKAAGPELFIALKHIFIIIIFSEAKCKQAFDTLIVSVGL